MKRPVNPWATALVSWGAALVLIDPLALLLPIRRNVVAGQ